jgi:hypothetical protein
VTRLPGQINKLKETFNNMAGDLVAKAVPAVSDFVGFISEKGVPALGQFFGAIGDAAQDRRSANSARRSRMLGRGS